MKKFRLVLLYVLLLSVIIAAIALILKNVKFPAQEVSIHGTITRDGKPLEWKSEDRQLLVWFMPVNQEPNADIPLYPAECDTDNGTFSIAKIPTGSYVVALQQNDPHPLQDLLGFAYSPANSKLRYDVTHDGQEFLIDLPKEIKRPPGPGMPKGRPAGFKGPEPKDDD